MEGTEGARLTIKVARLYHVRGLRQVEIAQRLRLSQPRVSRLLKQAEELGLVRNVVAVPVGLHRDLEVALARRYRLAAAYVLDVASIDDGELSRDLGHAAAALFAQGVAAARTIGFTSWSRTLRHMVSALQPMHVGTERVVETLGDLGAPTLQQDTAHLTQRLATLTGGQPTFLRVPGVVSSRAIREALLAQDAHARAALELLDEVDLTLMSVGPCEVVAPLRAGDNYFTDEQLADARRRGAVGQVCLRFLGEDGEPVATPLDDLVVGVTVEQLRRAGDRWMVGGGPGKYAVIRAALRGGWVHRLVTDTATAEHLLAPAEPAVEPVAADPDPAGVPPRAPAAPIP